jgi:SAM-dependent methyltransferase
MAISLNEQARINWVEDQLKKLPGGAVILDAGAGEQQYRKFCSHLNYISQDFAAYNPLSNEHGLQVDSWDYGKLDIISDITNIPKPDAYFDAILCTEVFEHIPDPIAAIKEFSRLLKPGGVLIVTAPFCSMTHFAPFHFSTGFNKYYYEVNFPAYGFKILELTPNGNYFTYLAQETGRIPYVAHDYKLPAPGFIQRLALKIMQRTLNKYAVNGDKSSELMSFGWHVRAEKV